MTLSSAKQASILPFQTSILPSQLVMVNKWLAYGPVEVAVSISSLFCTASGDTAVLLVKAYVEFNITQAAFA